MAYLSHVWVQSSPSWMRNRGPRSDNFTLSSVFWPFRFGHHGTYLSFANELSLASLPPVPCLIAYSLRKGSYVSEYAWTFGSTLLPATLASLHMKNLKSLPTFLNLEPNSTPSLRLQIFEKPERFVRRRGGERSVSWAGWTGKFRTIKVPFNH